MYVRTECKKCVRGNWILCEAVVTQCSLCRRDKLWISMEYCGGGSLQDIYHGKNSMHPKKHTHFNLNPAVFCLHLFSHSPLSIHLSDFYSLSRFTPPVTGPLSESQIAYMSRETLQVPYAL